MVEQFYPTEAQSKAWDFIAQNLTSGVISILGLGGSGKTFIAGFAPMIFTDAVQVIRGAVSQIPTILEWEQEKYRRSETILIVDDASIHDQHELESYRSLGFKLVVVMAHPENVLKSVVPAYMLPNVSPK